MQGFSFALLSRAGQQLYLNPQGIHPFRDGLVVLVGQYFGGDHQTSLKPIVNSQQHAHESHQCFTTAYIALQQAVHLLPGVGIKPDFAQYPFLCIGEAKGQKLAVKTVEMFPYLFKTESSKMCSLIMLYPKNL